MLRPGRKPDPHRQAAEDLDLGVIAALRPAGVRWLRLCSPVDLTAEVRRMQAMHADEIVIALQRFTAGPPTAKRILDETELLLDTAGCRTARGGLFFVVAIDELERVLARASQLTGVPLLTAADRDEMIRAQVAVRMRRDWL